MEILEKVLAGLVERVFRNRITSIVGVLVMLAGALGGAGKAVSADLVLHGVHVQAALLTIASIVGGVALLLAKDAGVKVEAVKLLAFLAIGLSFASSAAHAQTAPANLQTVYAAGVSFNAGGSAPVAGTALYARRVADSGTYAFTVIDAVPGSAKPFTVTSNVGIGIAQKVLTIGSVPVYVPTAAGISWTGSNTGWQWNAGAIASIHIKGSYYVMPSLRVLKSSVSNGAGYQPIVGVLVAWGK